MGLPCHLRFVWKENWKCDTGAWLWGDQAENLNELKWSARDAEIYRFLLAQLDKPTRDRIYLRLVCVGCDGICFDTLGVDEYWHSLCWKVIVFIMHRSTWIVLVVLVGNWLASTVGVAREIEPWSYERLFKAADLVVIARAMETKDSTDTTSDNPWKTEMLGLDTTLHVRVVVKGAMKGNSVTVLHFRLKDDKPIPDGPLLVSFKRGPIKVQLSDLEGDMSESTVVPEYLLFLRSRKDGRYEPVAGRVDPELSVRELYPPLQSRLHKQKPE